VIPDGRYRTPVQNPTSEIATALVKNGMEI